MNFLAHAYLSFGNRDLIVGNIIADMIKGRQIEKLPFEIQQGIHLHRQIDTFTDSHEVVKESKWLFENTAGRYSGLFLDIAYDHFLARSPLFEPAIGWDSFALKCYEAIESHSSVLPSHFINMYLYMRKENWLANYKNEWLIEKSFERLQSRTTFLSKDICVFDDFEKHYDQLALSFEDFFPDLIDFVKNLDIKS